MGDFDLTLIVGGRRLARDGVDGRDLLNDLSFSTTAQGGHKQLDGSLLRSIGDSPTESPFDDVELYGAGGVSVWEGRLQRMSRTVTRRTQRQAPSALGNAVVFEDRQDARFLGIDRDLAKWQAPTLTRRRQLISVPLSVRDAGSQNGSLRFDVSGPWTTAEGRPCCTARYQASPLNVGHLVWQGYEGTNISPSMWAAGIDALNADGEAVALLYGDWADAPETGSSPSTSSGTPAVTPIGYPGVELNVYTGASTGAEQDRFFDLHGLAVVGDHGLPLYDGGSGPKSYGVKASDALRWLISTYCPSLRPGEIVDSQLPIQHMAYLDPQSPGAIWNAINAYHGWTWGVWEDRAVDAGPFGLGRSRTWYVRAADAGVEINQDGDDASSIWTDIVVGYTTPTGEPRTVGGPGTTAGAFNEALSVEDSANPAVAAGVRRVYFFDLGVPTVESTAVAVGQTMLAQLNAARRAGTVSVQGYATDESRLPAPVYMMRGGDQLVITDIGDLTPRRIVDTTYTHQNRRVTLTVDNTRQTVEGIVANLGARTRN